MAVTKKGNKWYTVQSKPIIEDGVKKYKQTWVPTDATTKTAAKDIESNLKRQRRRGIEITTMTVQELSVLWMEKHVKDPKKPLALSTQEWYQDNLDNYINHEIGPVKLRELLPVHVDDVLNYCMKKDKQDTTLRAAYATMRAMFSWGVKWKYLEDNPAKRVEKPVVAKRKIKILDIEQVFKLIEIAKKDHFFHFFIVAAFTGLRADEVAGVRISDINFEKKSAAIVQQVTKCGKKPSFGPIKNRKDDFEIPLPDIVLDAIKEELKKRPIKKRLALDKKWGWKEYDLVFTNKTGGPVDSHNISQRNFQNFLEKAGIEHVKFHALRHSFVTNLLELGVPIESVSDLVNHADMYFTRRTYGHSKATSRRDSSDLYEKAVLQQKTTVNN